MINTKINQTRNMGKHDSAVAMLRLVRELMGRLEDAGEITDDEKVQCDNVYYTFLETLPKKVAEEVHQG